MTGGTGLVGFNIIQSLLKRKYHVTALVRDLEKGKRLLPAECSLVKADIWRARFIKGCHAEL